MKCTELNLNEKYLHEKHSPPADPAAACNSLLEKLLQVSREDIEELLQRRATRRPADEQPHSQRSDSDCRSRTDISN